MRIIPYLLLLIAVIYGVLIIIPGRDHEAAQLEEHERTLTGNFLTNLLSQAEEEATTPPEDGSVIVARADRLLASGALVQEDDGTYRMQTADGEWIEIAAIINPADLIPEGPEDPAITSVAIGEEGPVDSATPEAADPATPVAAPILWQVTGTRVNFRSGPTTNSDILTALVQGDLVEYLGDGPDGWARLRVPSTGIEGYMSVDFLAPVN